MKNLKRFLKTLVYIIASFKKEQFLIGLKITYFFIKTKFIFQIKKAKLLNIVKNHKKIIKTKKINFDFFSHTIPYIYETFEKKNYFKKNIKILEIGSFEGNSTLFFLDFFYNSQIYCIDTFKPYFEIPGYDSKSLDLFNDVYKNFKFNLDKYINRVKIFKLESDEFFENHKSENIKFDLIYIDGLHHAENVWKDLNHSFLILNKGGYIICDDYTSVKFDKPKNNPIYSINEFIKENKNELRIIKVYDQIIIKKI